MIESAQQLELAEKALRKIVCDLIADAPSSPTIYETVLELAAVGKAMQERIRVELESSDSQIVLCVGAGI
jgi:tRNA threonylcarbamoyladenosine modification (KEOPS) complex  Pcc1 subunit